MSDLELARANEFNDRVKSVLQATKHRKAGMSLEPISKATEIAKSTVYGWLLRLEGDLDRRHDRKSPGRPCRLSEEQRRALEEDLRKSSRESGFLREPCTDKMIVRRIGNRFGIKYGINRILGLTYKMGFSVRKPRLVSHNSTTEGEQKAYVERTVKEMAARDGTGYKVLCLGVAGFVDSPTFGRGIRPREEMDTV